MKTQILLFILIVLFFQSRTFAQAEVTQTIHKAIVELDYEKNYDKTRKMILTIIDMPDRLVDLFINLCLQNNGILSAGKKSKYFDFLTDNELSAMEQVIKDTFTQQG